MVLKKLCINMPDRGEKSRTENLFVSYYSFLRRHVLSWVVIDNQKVAAFRLPSAFRPELLRPRIEKDSAFSHRHPWKYFQEFMLHAVRLSGAFQLVDNRKPTSSEPV
eukprot:Plantae.Rhodophyta-Rhodochaete_pulchella.ctg9188.p1 GENE.Plantae.Rhodophyta-Rhodochaete_pulchella.ctg9188~~Plantae.Rhodophyta-Rhodochaete_pulchella.ctg9188.p1  ORF type:complete len:107 (-),score=11.28 Plantae.Rhodophyta-Rhodochaete_pulchella.ctg9188:366-686(-)